MTPHEVCINLLNHELTQALACGRRLGFSEVKSNILCFGAIHLLVVSGAHLNFLKKVLSFLKLPPFLHPYPLLSFVIACNFSAPILRAYIQTILRNQRKLYLPKAIGPLLSYLLCLPISYLNNEIISLSLSFLFGVIILYLPVLNKASHLMIYLLAFPIFLFIINLPHYSSIFMLPLIGVFVMALMPLSILSLASNKLEALTINMWWQVEDLIMYVSNFYNKPQAASTHFQTNTHLNLFLYGFLLFFTSYSIRVLWQKSSYSL